MLSKRSCERVDDLRIAYDELTKTVMLKDVGDSYTRLKNMGMVWDKPAQMLKRKANLEFLTSLSAMIKLPDNIEKERVRLKSIEEALFTERAKERSVPYIKPPINPQFAPYQHQIKAYNMALIHFGILQPTKKSVTKMSDSFGGGFGFLFEMGCGKTLTAIMTVGTLYIRGLVKRLLIVAPTSVCSVWVNEFQQYGNFRSITKVLLGTKQQRLKALNDLETVPLSCLKVAVINYESVWRDGIQEALSKFAPDMIICDESQRIKTHDAKQSRALHELGDRTRYKLILSGTPVQNNAMDLFSQYRFMEPDIFGTNFYVFRNRYAIMGGYNNKQVIGYKDMDELVRKEYSAAYRVTKEEALDLPEQIFTERIIELSPKERVMYESIKRAGFAELANDKKISAATALVKLLRLQQFTGGFILPDENSKPELISKGKLNALEEIVDDYCLETGKKLVVFARFRAEIELIAEMLRKKKLQFGLIYGDVKLEARGEIVRDFQTNKNTMVFLAQIDTAGLGITLTAADTCVFYSVNFNLATYLQALARIHRIGQRNACTYIHLTAKDTIDSKVLAALAKKEDIAKTIVDNWKEYFT